MTAAAVPVVASASVVPVAAVVAPVAPPAPTKPYPKTDKRPSHDHYASVNKDLTDDYAWLEDPTSADVRSWADAENAYTRKVLDATPGREAIHQRVTEVMSGESADYFDLSHHGKTLFALKNQPPKQQPMLVTLASADDTKSERVLLDPNDAAYGGKTEIDWFMPSRDGKLVAVSLSQGGSEHGDLHILDVATLKERTGDALTHVHNGTAGGAVAWNADGSGFYYTRYPHKGDPHADEESFFQTIWFHKLGTAEKDDVYVLGKDFPRIAEIAFSTPDNGNALLAHVSNGDGGEFDQWYFDGKLWTKIAEYKDKVIAGGFGRDGSVFLLSRESAPRGKVLRIDARALAGKDTKSRILDKATVVVPESDVVIEGFRVTQNKLLVLDLVGGPSQIRSFDLAPKVKKGAAGKPIAPVGTIVSTPPISSVGQMVWVGGDNVLYRTQSFTEPPAWYAYDARAEKGHKTKLFETATVSFDDAEVVQVQCTSKDGTKVPMSILRKKGIVLDGSHFALLNGYGGYSVSRPPRFDAIRRIWLDHDGVFANANIRGGGEFGEAWHEQGKLTKKQNVFDDFASCAAELLDEKYATIPHLAIIGGSNGGLLMGAELTQHPQMFGAVVSYVGIYDMLHVERSPNGRFNVTEFGTVDDADQFNALYAYSPYHHVVDGAKYPATLMLTGDNDPRVEPWHSRKMIARLQEATSSDAPILLRTDKNVGHGIGSPLSAEIDQWTDVFSFLFTQLGPVATK